MDPGGGRAALAVHVARVPGTRRRLARDLGRLAAFAADHYDRVLELSFAAVDDEHMTRLHDRYAGQATPTDVLSFVLADEPVLHGEVIVSVDTARREAASRGHSAYDELLLYAVHGVLHLVGHDDHTPAQRSRMRRAERQALRALGRPSVFGSGGRRTGRRTRS